MLLLWLIKASYVGESEGNLTVWSAATLGAGDSPVPAGDSTRGAGGLCANGAGAGAVLCFFFFVVFGFFFFLLLLGAGAGTSVVFGGAAAGTEA
ncbi:hypothetical protein GW17_00008116, partial [Ensete ventricosum]